MVSFMVSVPAMLVVGVAMVGAEVYSITRDERQQLLQNNRL
jgi:hypothetical protein